MIGSTQFGKLGIPQIIKTVIFIVYLGREGKDCAEF